MTERKSIHPLVWVGLGIFVAMLLFCGGLLAYVGYAANRARRAAELNAEAEAIEARVRLQREEIRRMESQNEALRRQLEDELRDLPPAARRRVLEDKPAPADDYPQEVYDDETIRKRSRQMPKVPKRL